MACGCSGGGSVGLNRAGVNDAGAQTQNRIVYRLLKPGTSDPQDCVVRTQSDQTKCMNFVSLQTASQYKIDNSIDATPVGVIVPVQVGG